MLLGIHVRKLLGGCLVLSGLLGFASSLASESQREYILELPASPDAQSVKEENLGYSSAIVLISALNKLLLENNMSQKAFVAKFGLEPEGVFDHLKENGDSAFLTHLFLTLKQESEKKVELRVIDKSQCWLLSQEGDYRQYACGVEIKGSKYKRGIILFRIEVIESDFHYFSVSAKPSMIYVALP